MEIKEVTNIKTGKKRYYINGIRVGVEKYNSLNMRTLNCSVQYRTNERIYSLFCL